MARRRAKVLIAVEGCRDCGGSGCSWCADTGRVRESKPSPVDLVAAVRAGVESGTIKGTEIGVFPTFEGDHVIEIPGQRKKRLADELEPGTYLVILVSDGGSET